MAYYSAENCVSGGDISGCITDYAVSDVRQVVDVWKTNYASGANQARLATIEEISALGYEYQENDTSMWYNKTANTPSWVYAPSSDYYWYWTMSQFGDKSSAVWDVHDNGGLGSYSVVGLTSGSVRPVIVLSKTLISSN